MQDQGRPFATFHAKTTLLVLWPPALMPGEWANLLVVLDTILLTGHEYTALFHQRPMGEGPGYVTERFLEGHVVESRQR